MKWSEREHIVTDIKDNRNTSHNVGDKKKQCYCLYSLLLRSLHPKVKFNPFTVHDEKINNSPKSNLVIILYVTVQLPKSRALKL